MTRIADHALALAAAILITATAFHQATVVPADSPAMAQGFDTVLAA
jgi:hypothetical protein